MIKPSKKALVIGGGLITASVLVSGLAVAGFKSHHHGKGHHHDMAASIMKKLDGNGDNKLSAEEFTSRATAYFTTLDSDGDGLISQEEFLTRPMARFAKFDSNDDGFIGEDELPTRGKFKGGKSRHGKGYGKHDVMHLHMDDELVKPEATALPSSLYKFFLSSSDHL